MPNNELGLAGASIADAVDDERHRARVVCFEDLPEVPWPNGGGLTREVHREFSTKHDAQPMWRVSIATVDATGCFSVLPGVRRCLVLASRTDLQLSVDGKIHPLGYTDSVEFDGAAHVEVVHVSGPSLAINLMCYGGVRGTMAVDRPEGFSSCRAERRRRWWYSMAGSVSATRPWVVVTASP